MPVAYSGKTSTTTSPPSTGITLKSGVAVAEVKALFVAREQPRAGDALTRDEPAVGAPDLDPERPGGTLRGTWASSSGSDASTRSALPELPLQRDEGRRPGHGEPAAP